MSARPWKILLKQSTTSSLPTLLDLLIAPNERPVTFRRGYDVFDPLNVGFAVPALQQIGPTGSKRVMPSLTMETARPRAEDS